MIDRFHAEFIRGRAPNLNQPGQARHDYRRQMSERLNPGQSSDFHEAFARGRRKHIDSIPITAGAF